MLAALVVLGISFHNFSFVKENAPDNLLHLPSEDFSQIDSDGKLIDAKAFDQTYNATLWEQLGFPVIDEKIVLGLQHQLRVLEAGNFRDGQKVGNLSFTYADMKTVIDLLLARADSVSSPKDLHQVLEAHQVWGGDQKGNVFFTGYFTPTVKVKKTKDTKYKYPIYSYPEDWEGKLPSRLQIDGEGALEGKNLELAYASDPFDIYVMQLQGTGSVEFVDTKERMLFEYAGKNNHRYRNIQWFFKNRDDISLRNLSMDGIRRFVKKHPQLRDSILFFNPSYTFFSPKKGLVKGAARVPLLETVSIAADPRYFPLGSVFLAALPVYKNGKITHHQYRLLLPQDVGGVVKGPGHVDVYHGVGAVGKANAMALHHYGRMWLLLPKKNEQVAMK